METTVSRLQKIAGRSTLQVTHVGRKTGKSYQVTTWFIVQGEKILIPTSNIDRNWVRNVRKTPHVELSIGGDTLVGEARFLESTADRERVRALVKRKYRIAAPLLATLQLFASLGLGAFKYGAFEVSLSG